MLGFRVMWVSSSSFTSPSSIRFIATVTISVSDASIACAIKALSLNFPVPKKNRELNSRPAIISLIIIYYLFDDSFHFLHRILCIQHGSRQSHTRDTCLHHRWYICCGDTANSNNRKRYALCFHLLDDTPITLQSQNGRETLLRG